MSDSGGEFLGLDPASRIHGEFRPPGSKSASQRALLAAAWAHGRTTIEGFDAGEDVGATLGALRTLGVRLETRGTAVAVHGSPPADSGGLEPRAALEVGESGTLARLASALLALGTRPGSRWTVRARGSLLFRKSPPLFGALRSAGVDFARQNLPGTWPVEFVSVRPPQTLTLVRPVSSQEVSGLLLALATWDGTRRLEVQGVVPSEPYLALTLRTLEEFGVAVRAQATAEARTFEVEGPLQAPGQSLGIEPDASSAAVALCAAALSGGSLRVPGLGSDSPQGDRRIVEHLSAFGCESTADAGGLSAGGEPRRGVELDLRGEPDLAPVLAAVAAAAALRHRQESRLAGLGTLPGKESDRLGTLAEGLRALGLRATSGADWLAIAPGAGAAPGPLRLDPRGDHRMAFAFALFGLLRPDVLVRDPGCVAKSWPAFWTDMERLGARLIRG